MKRAKKHFDSGWIKSFTVLLAVLSVLAIASCAKPVPPPAPAAVVEVKAPNVRHVIQYHGETLGLIAQWYTGKTANWTLIESANPGIEVNKLKIGTVIVIPGDIVIQREPLPEKFIRRHSANLSVPPPPASERTSAGLSSESTASVKGQGESAVVDEVPKEVSPASPDKSAEALALSSEQGKDNAASNAVATVNTASPEKDAAGAEKRAEDAVAEPSGNSEEAERERLLEELLEQP